ncbi:unnamed protein product [Arctia plantaginis]|uniref:Retrotransposon gag domain-containing protein n=1 Tax=Arctia plantaginis TaxID=874455 RepID=A0A8S1AVN8_ARCPL|nr:unnamed protein product [Arctia plantaginis]
MLTRRSTQPGRAAERCVLTVERWGVAALCYGGASGPLLEPWARPVGCMFRLLRFFAVGPPPPFQFANSLCNITSGNLSTEWQKWKTAFNIYYEACELSNKNKKTQVNILLHIVGEKCREVAAQFNEQWNTVDELLKKFDDFFIPKKNLAVERHKFFKRDQRELESAEQYVFELNKMAVQCEFKDLRDDLVCSRLICGIRDIALSERLLREPDMMLEKAIEICRLAEMSRMQARNIKENQEYDVSGAQSVNNYKSLCRKQIAIKIGSRLHFAT